jgi:hypothetical protein
MADPVAQATQDAIGLFVLSLIGGIADSVLFGNFLYFLGRRGGGQEQLEHDLAVAYHFVGIQEYLDALLDRIVAGSGQPAAFALLDLNQAQSASAVGGYRLVVAERRDLVAVTAQCAKQALFVNAFVAAAFDLESNLFLLVRHGSPLIPPRWP